MKASIFFRISAVLLALFAAGHTFGFLSFVAPTPEAVSVKQAMDSVRFGSASLSYGDIYKGFGLFVSAALVFVTIMAWWAGDLSKTAPGSARFLGATLVLFMLASLILSLTYFAFPPAVFSAVIALCMAAGSLLAGKSAARA